jgi:hypothetical protein
MGEGSTAMNIGAMASAEFCDSMVTTAIESGPGGWFTVIGYKWQDQAPGKTFAVIEEDENSDGTRWTVDAALIRKGLDVIGQAVFRQADNANDGLVLHNAETADRLYMGQDMARRIIHAATADEDDWDLDAVDALAIVECGLFGRVVYA